MALRDITNVAAPAEPSSRGCLCRPGARGTETSIPVPSKTSQAIEKIASVRNLRASATDATAARQEDSRSVQRTQSHARDVATKQQRSAASPSSARSPSACATPRAQAPSGGPAPRAAAAQRPATPRTPRAPVERSGDRTPRATAERGGERTPRAQAFGQAQVSAPGRAATSGPRGRAASGERPAASAGPRADADADRTAWANALHEQEKRREELLKAFGEERQKVSALLAEVPELERRAATCEAELGEASESHTEKVGKLREREAALQRELETTLAATAVAQRQADQIAAGMRAKASELEEHRARLDKLRTEQAGCLRKAEAKAARIRALNSAVLHEEAEAARRCELLAESVVVTRRLHNEYLSLKGNIRVFCRLRPRLPRDADDLARVEIHDGSRLVIHSETQKSVTGLTEQSSSWGFDFDHVFGETSSQAAVFEEISLLVQSALDGYKVAIFAYGQTGSGKTHTMDGPPPESRTEETAGVIPRTVDLIFTEVQQMRQKGWAFEVHASCLEVYNEVVRDLLATSKTEPTPTAGGGGSRRDGWLSAVPPPPSAKEASASAEQFTTRRVENASAVHALLRRAAKERRTAMTLCNDRSSRSHAIFQLAIVGRRGAGSGSGASDAQQEVRGLLSLVDLAGSERVERSGASGDRMKEAQHINRSLSALGDVVEALARRKQQGAATSGGCHVPYRNSRLTMLLKDSLGGESKALMFVNISPCLRHLGETVSSLRFASKVHACSVGMARRNAAGVEERDTTCGIGSAVRGGLDSPRSSRTPAKRIAFTPAATPAKDTRSLAERLRELQELRDDGLLSPSEFEETRKHIIASC